MINEASFYILVGFISHSKFLNLLPKFVKKLLARGQTCIKPVSRFFVFRFYIIKCIQQEISSKNVYNTLIILFFDSSCKM
jgi:hypothetical protein